MACAPLTPSSPKYPTSLLQACEDLQKIEDGSGKTILLWAVDTVSKYEECKLKHKKLVESINK